MRRTVGVLVMEHIAVGLVEGDKVVGPLNIFPEKSQTLDPLQSMPAESIVECVRQQVEKVASGEKIAAIGIGFPGIIRAGVVEDSPNLQQIKGFALQSESKLGWSAGPRPARSPLLSKPCLPSRYRPPAHQRLIDVHSRTWSPGKHR